MIRYNTLAAALAHIGDDAPERGFIFQDLRGKETLIPFPELAAESARRAAALTQLGLRKGDRFALIVVDPQQFVLTFLGALRMGAIPVPLYPPLSFAHLNTYLERIQGIAQVAETRLVVVSELLMPILQPLVERVDCLEQTVAVEKLIPEGDLPELPQITPDDIAFLQYTSGSTAAPKGVMVTHATLAANCQRIIENGLKLDPERDVATTWLPLYHDMGLIGFVAAPIFYAIQVTFIPTLRFLSRPSVWMETVHRTRSAATFGPNFAYALATRRVKPKELEEWDLSCLEVCGCGAEPIQPETMHAFTSLFHEHCGLPESAIMPAYGMAEATLAITLQDKHTPMHCERIDAAHFEQHGVVQAPTEGALVMEHVSCGPPLPEHEVQVRGESGDLLPDGHQGELYVRGPSITPGYFKDPDNTAASFRDGWLATGDTGYMLAGEVYVTGRTKDLIILRGRNIHPQSVEWIVSGIKRVRTGNVVAFSRQGADSEELVIALESKIPPEEHDDLKSEVKRLIQQELGVAVADVRVLGRGELPKTSSGKLQRRLSRKQYLDGTLGRSSSRASRKK